MYFSWKINFVINVSVWVYLIYFNRIKVTLPADRRTMTIGEDSSLAAERSLGMLNNNPVIHHGVWGVGRLCSSWGEAPRSSSQPWGMANWKWPVPSCQSIFLNIEALFLYPLRLCELVELKTYWQLGASICISGMLLIYNSIIKIRTDEWPIVMRAAWALPSYTLWLHE